MKWVCNSLTNICVDFLKLFSVIQTICLINEFRNKLIEIDWLYVLKVGIQENLLNAKTEKLLLVITLHLYLVCGLVSCPKFLKRALLSAVFKNLYRNFIKILVTKLE